MSDERILRTLRAQAWERAKGELNSILSTYWDDIDSFKRANLAINRFVDEIEGEGLAE